MENMPWIKSYPKGLRWDAELLLAPVTQLLDDAVARWPDRPALDFMGRKIGYAELAHHVDRMAAGLQQLGVGPGVHVGLYLPNTPHYVIAFFAVLKAGGTVVNYSPLDAAQVLEHKVEDSATDVLITLDLAALYPNIRGLLGASRLKCLVVGSLGDFAAEGDAVNAHMAKAGQSVPLEPHAQQERFLAVLQSTAALAVHPIQDPTQALAVLQYTGGTTGLPKGAQLTHANLTAATTQAALNCTAGEAPLKEGEERLLVVLPLFHIYALVVNMLLGIRLGGELVLCLKFDPGSVLKDISQRRISCFPGVPTMFTALVSHPDVEQHDLRSLKVCNSGGAPLPVELLHRFEALTGCHLTEGWGMTETTSLGTFTPMVGQAKPGSCGIPAPGVRLKLIDVDRGDMEVGVAERGEIVIAGANVMTGYWNQPEATRNSFTADGFFRTGDVGYMDEDGFVYIVDRTKDMLLCGGFNVYPRVIEEAIYAHPAVEEVLVIGVPDAYRGQSPKAYIKLREGAPALTLEALQDFLKTRLGKHEMVREMELRAGLPKTAVGKLSKKMLHDEIAKEQSRQPQAA